MNILIDKEKRELTLCSDEGTELLRCPVGLGRAEGPKRRSGDLRTPEGDYYVCLKKENGKYGPSLGLSYPAVRDAERGVAEGIISGGMIPKIDGMTQALRQGCKKAFIIDGRVPHSILMDMLTDEGMGTMFRITK